MSSYAWIDQAQQLAQHVNAIAGADALALDTEFVRTDTFYPNLGLFQIGLADRILLVDTLVPSCLEGLSQALFDAPQPPLWVLHSCAEDLEVVLNQWGRLPAKVADTQLAAAYLGHTRQMSLQNLLLAELGVHVPKDETRSDWCRRPLSEAQLEYAAEDVRYLHPLWDKLRAALKAQERLTWFEEDCERLLQKSIRQIPPDQIYLQFNDAFQLKDKSLAVLQALAAWREDKARQLNKPRGFIIKDPVLYAIAERLPKNAVGLAGIPNILPSAVRRFSDELLGIVANTSVAEGLLRPLRPLTASQRQTLKQIKAWLEVQADRLNMPIELLAGRRVLEHLIRQYSNEILICHEEWKGWRQAVLEPGIIEILQSANSE